MEDKQTDKTPSVAPKSFLTVGPTLHYSHRNVMWCWLLALGAFSLTCLFFSKVTSGSFFSFSFATLNDPTLWRLGRLTDRGVSIFEYPWQITVLGLLMGIIAVAPVLISQLMSLPHSLLFVIAVFFLADLPAFAACLFISCVAVACRPLRFRSRFVAIGLCTVPQLLYWGFLGSIRGVEPIRWGFSFAPWLLAWLVALAVAGLVLGIGHYTRYRPGLVWASTVLVLLGAIITFELTIGFDELDYQLYVAKNNPKKVAEFHDKSITSALDKAITDPQVRRYLAGFFYPTEPIALRKRVKEKILQQLRQDRWPSWLLLPTEFKYQQKRDSLFEQYEKFIIRRSRSLRMPIALYYKALLSEYTPDTKRLAQSEVLHFYDDYPFERSQPLWYRLYLEFPSSCESIEARWRIVMYWAGQGRFEQAEIMLAEAQKMLDQLGEQLGCDQQKAETFLGLFSWPAESAVTQFDAEELAARFDRLQGLLGPKNRSEDKDCKQRLAKFVRLNPHGWDYEVHLDTLLKQIKKSDVLYDNILHAKVKLIADERLRAERLAQIHKEFGKTDGGMRALYDLTVLKIGFWRQYDGDDPKQKENLLAEARNSLAGFVGAYPDSYLAEQAKGKLQKLLVVN